ncbi:MAG: fatty acyl-CoA reductase [Zhongshania sp.]|uniref:fatty acyl-CoA reductase n=1 Tax=Zhongshania sp. TaxID=1971902 RepID=UPI00261E994A|nr:fatty acyl-CoA reductase [Zhongshania sp.]MDF1693456.1 fatty acyl-CoA reductase [Zhongshania sp.]
MTTSKGVSQTLQLLKGKHILITGTTGFVGKVMLEKIMRTVPDIGGVYLVIRGSKKHANAGSRFANEIATSSVFENLKLNSADYFNDFCNNRIHCITGEISERQFGLPRQEFRALADKLDAVVNCAASVNFREELDRALAINTHSLRNIVELSDMAGNIPVIQVSTCYVNGFNKGHIHETIVTPARGDIPRHKAGYFEVGNLIEELELKIAELYKQYQGKELKTQLIDLGIREANACGWNDTYTFTKWLGEQLLLKSLRGYSLTLLRPSIVESTLREPSPGWIEGVKVADAILLAYAREKVTFFPGKRSGIIDIIPADLVANSLLLALAEQFKTPGNHHVYQCCSGSANPLNLGTFIDHLMAEAKENHASYDKLFMRQPRKPFIAVDKRLFNAITLCMRFVLLVASQTLAKVGWKRGLKARRNLDAAIALSTIFSFYTEPEYIFHNNKLIDLAKRMGPADEALFPVDARAINWETYLRKIHMAGLNCYALKGKRQASVPNTPLVTALKQAA